MVNAKKLTNHERSVKAASERWNPTIPRATHSGTLIIGNVELACDVLNDGRRVLRQRTFLKAMGRGKVGGKERKGEECTNLPVFLQANNLRPFLGDDFKDGGDLTIIYKGINGQKLLGYDATVLPKACKIYAKAEDAEALQGNQDKIAKVCRIMLYSLASVGITSLIDEVTGYQEIRERNELQKILEKYIAEELRGWTEKFPNEFFKQVYRLHGWEYPRPTKAHLRPQCVGNFINRYVYEKLPPGVLDELKSKNPPNEKGHRSYRHHQFLTEDIGDDNLKKQITQTVTLMKVSENLDQFKAFINKI